MICQRDFFETCQHDGTQQVDKATIGQFPQKSSFSVMGQFGPKLCNLISQVSIYHNVLSENFEML